MAKRQVISCPWQDEQGTVLALGTIVFEASGDALVPGTGELCSGIKGKLTLDVNGTVAASPAQYMWPTDQMTPSNITYTVWVYNANGQLAWGPNYGLTVPSGAGSFNLCTWVPNQIGAGSGASAGSLTLQTNGINNGSQQLLDLQQGANITLTDNGSGQVTVAAAGSSGPRARTFNEWVPDGSDGLNPATGLGMSIGGNHGTGGALTGVSPTATTNKMLLFSSGSSGSVGFVACTGAHTADSYVTLGILGLLELKLLTPQLTTTRTWTGLGKVGSGANFYASDTPPVPLIGFRYSTGASDAHWQCVVTDGTTQLTVSSGIVPDTSAHTFGVQFSSPNVLFFIDGVQVGSLAITTTTLTAASGLNPVATVDTVGTTNTIAQQIEYMYWDTLV